MITSLYMFCAGIIAALAIPHAGVPGILLDISPFSFIFYVLGLAVLYRALTRIPSRIFARPALYTYCWFMGFFTFSLSWVANALLIDGNPYAWAYPFALFGLPLLLSLYPAIVIGALFRFLSANHTRTITPMIMVLGIGVAEYARAHMLTGFPWNMPSYVWSETTPIFQSLSAIGPYALSILTLCWALSIILAITAGPEIRRHWGFQTFSIISFIAVLLYGQITLNESQKSPTRNKDTPVIQVVMVQANVPQSEKWDSNKIGDHFYKHIQLSLPQGPIQNIKTLVVWPETALPPELTESPVAKREIKKMLSHYPSGSVLITGAIRADFRAPRPTFYNSLLIYDQTGQTIQSYDKHHLVPFGEYMPFQDIIPFGPLAKFEGLQSGPKPEPLALQNSISITPLICYEVIFPGEVRRISTTSAPILVNITNDSWYGNSAGPYQHLAQARARAIENGQSMIRVAGTGVSATINPWGQIQNKITYNVQKSNISTLWLYSMKYNIYKKYGDSAFFILGIGLFLLILRNYITKKRYKL
jgi:apolipoprotein N-acyltransferase